MNTAVQPGWRACRVTLSLVYNPTAVWLRKPERTALRTVVRRGIVLDRHTAGAEHAEQHRVVPGHPAVVIRKVIADRSRCRSHRCGIRIDPRSRRGVDLDDERIAELRKRSGGIERGV